MCDCNKNLSGLGADGVTIPWWCWDQPNFKTASDKCLSDAQKTCGGNETCVRELNEMCHVTLISECLMKQSAPPAGTVAPPGADKKKTGTVGTTTSNTPPAAYKPPAAQKSLLSNPLVLAGIAIGAIVIFKTMSKKGKKS